MRADATDLAEHAGMHALARHGHQALALETSEILAELDGPRTERARTRQSGQIERL